MIAADGKETHNTGKKSSEDPTERCNLNEFNVMSTEWGISLSSTRMEEKSNEIPEMQKVIKQIDYRGCVVTADAMNTQKATAKTIIEEAHGDYCLEEKPENGNLEVKEYFACKEFLKEIKTKEGQYFRETEETTYSVTTREYFITDNINWLEDSIYREMVLSVQHQADRRIVRNRCTQGLAYRKWATLGD